MDAQRFAARNEGAYGLDSGLLGLSSRAWAKNVLWMWIMASRAHCEYHVALDTHSRLTE